MKRSLFGALAAVALLASPAVAQDGTLNYQSFSNGGWVNNLVDRQAAFTADFPGGDVLTPPALGTSFAVFCVDPIGTATPGSYDVFVTAIAQVNSMGQTRLGQAGVVDAYDRYWRAAFLVENFLTIPAPGGLTGSQYQFAIWAITTGNVAFYGQGDATILGLVALANAQVVDPVGFSDWGIITDADCTVGPNQDLCRQEFIYRTTDGGLEIVPEPATMTLLATGLAGMAAANRRRRKQK